MNWYGYLFWVWVIGSVLVFVWRRLNNSNSSSAPPRHPASTSQAIPNQNPEPPVTLPDYTFDRVPPSPEVNTPKTTLVSLLSGIQLPSGLAPLTHGKAAYDLDQVAIFATDTTSFPETKTQMEAELVRLGFELSPISSTSIRAHKADGDLEVEFFSSNEMERDFSTATNGATVVEIRVAT